MKFSFVVSTQPTKFDAVRKGNLQESLQEISALGYNGVELAIRDPQIVSTGELENLLSRYRLDLAAIGTGQAYLEENLSLSHPSKNVRNMAIKRITSHIDFASHFNAQVVIGLIRGSFADDLPYETSVTHLTECLQECCEMAEKRNVFLAIEPLNRYECNYLNTATAAVEFIKKVNCAGLKILLDTFHMNIEEKDISETIRSCGGLVSHMHLADSNRHAPGEGHIDFREIITTLKMIGYRGYLSFEILPVPSPQLAAKSAIEHVRNIISEVAN